jgi:hypothetical protein
MSLNPVPFLFSLILAAPVAGAQAGRTQEIPTDDVPSMTVNRGISETIYRQATASTSSGGVAAVTVDSLVQVFFPAELELKNNYFTVAYGEQAGSIPGFVVGPELPLRGGPGRARLSSFFHAGYAYAQGIYEAETDSGLAVKDAVELQWVPLQAGLDAATRPYTAHGVGFGAQASVGVDWLTQSGQLDGISQTFWVPRYELGPNVTLFGQTAPERGGFDGVRLSAVVYRSFASPQKSRGVAADLGARYAF